MIDPQWLMLAIAALGVVGQWGIGKRGEGRRDEKLSAHAARLNKHSQELDRLTRDQSKLGERVARVEARCSTLGHDNGD